MRDPNKRDPVKESIDNRWTSRPYTPIHYGSAGTGTLANSGGYPARTSGNPYLEKTDSKVGINPVVAGGLIAAGALIVTGAAEPVLREVKNGLKNLLDTLFRKVTK